ncbi:MAG: hypothetical protein C0467_01215 [Planctomycetaceae bacterium]|nr:hypothetical protein [Planctomycetaceae bacterium]
MAHVESELRQAQEQASAAALLVGGSPQTQRDCHLRPVSRVAGRVQLVVRAAVHTAVEEATLVALHM